MERDRDMHESDHRSTLSVSEEIPYRSDDTDKRRMNEKEKNQREKKKRRNARRQKKEELLRRLDIVGGSRWWYRCARDDCASMLISFRSIVQYPTVPFAIFKMT